MNLKRPNELYFGTEGVLVGLAEPSQQVGGVCMRTARLHTGAPLAAP
jgi:hypothetical protein